MTNQTQFVDEEKKTQAGFTQVRENTSNPTVKNPRPHSLRPGRSLLGSRSLRPGGQMRRAVKIKSLLK